MAPASRTAPTTVLLVRHGLTPTTGRVLPGRSLGLHLSDEGQRQAEAAARRIAKLERVAAIYSSPLERARETALAIAKARGLAVRIERGLLELDIGAWTGSSLARVSRKPEWQKVQRYPSGFRFPDGESFTEMQTRITGTLAELVTRHRGDTIVARLARRSDQGGAGARAGDAPRPLSAAGHRAGLDHHDRLRGDRAGGGRCERARRRSEARVSESYRLDAPDHFTVGTVGPPGQRVFTSRAARPIPW